MKFATAQKTKMLKNKDFLAFELSDVVCIIIMYVKMPAIDGTLTFVGDQI